MKRTTLILASALVLGGCGGSHQTSPTVKASTPSAATTSAAGGTTTTQPATNARTGVTPRTAVRTALAANHRLAIKVLWSNRIPLTARQSTRGPALAQLAASAKDREKKGVRVRMIRDDYRIVRIRLNPTGTRATALADWNQRVVPSHLDGTPLGRPVSLYERARIELRRADASQAFFVWKVTLVK
jgi:cation diffusion facilitator CzcD-associated flavoprotein CzcO